MKTYGVVLTNGKTLITTNWNDAKAFIATHPSGAKYKKFSSAAEAECFVSEKTACKVPVMHDKAEDMPKDNPHVIAYIDGSFNTQTNTWGSGVVIITPESGSTPVELTKQGTHFAEMRNVTGEVEAAMMAVEYALNKGFKMIEICHDYTGVANWATGQWNANNQLTKAYQEMMNDIMNRIAVRFTKVAAHTGVALNERADCLAKQACGMK